MKNKKTSYINLALIVAFFTMGFLIYRIGYLALSEEVDGINIQAFAETRTTKKNTLAAKRGNIYDGNGNILGTDISSYTLIAYLDPSRTIDESKPEHVVDKENTALVLAKILDMDKDTCLKYLSKEGVYQTEFGPKGKGLNEITKKTIQSANLPGLDFIETTKRYYPYGDFASYLVGYAKNNADGKTVGELGIEKYYNDLLTGTDGYTIYQKGRNGYKIAGTKEITVPAMDGASIYLTIDNNIQFFVEQAISKTTKYSYDEMSIIVADAKDAKILAYANYPSFDPNTRNITNYLDSISSIAFEPGSTMKIYTYMAALEAGVYKGSDTYRSGTFTTKDKTVIKDWNDVGWGWITYDKGFVYSSNTAVVNIMDKYMDANTLKKYFIKLGFGQKTGMPISNEASGLINFKYETEIFNAAFGQGVSTTPIQHIKALTSIANDGYMLNPYIVSKIVDGNGNVILSNEREVLGRVASSETIAYMKKLMYRTINESDGAGHGYHIKGYDLIGKTGTAQIASTNGKGYLTADKDHNRSVVIVFPKDDPKIIIYGVVKRSSVATPLSNATKEIVKNISKYYNIYQDEQEIKTKEEYQIDNYMNMDVKVVKNELTENKINVIVLGDGDKIINQYPKANSKILNTDKVILLTNSNKFKMPSLINYSKNEVITIMTLLDIPYIISGNGYVSEQSIKEGNTITKNDTIEITLKELYKD